MTQPVTPEGANRAFVESYLKHQWLDFIDDGEQEPHTEAILREVSRLGVSAHRQGKNILFFRDTVCVGAMMSATTSLNSNVSQTIASSKNLTKSVLDRASVPTPAARQFTEDQWDDAVAFLAAPAAGSRRVVKPSDGRQGMGITTGVSTEAELWDAWRRAMHASKSKMLLIEEEIPGVDVRVLVINGQAAAAAARIPPFIVGDGRSEVVELLGRLHQERSRHRYMKDRELKADAAYMERHGVENSSVLPEGEICFLNGTANLSRGGVAVDLTDALPQRTLQMAEKAAAAVPGLKLAGIDLLVPDVASRDGAAVVEVNSSPNLLVHDTPAFGQPRQMAAAVASAIVGLDVSRGRRGLRTGSKRLATVFRARAS